MRWTRTLNNLDQQVEVVIGPVEREQSSGDCYCHWQIIGLGEDKSGEVFGIDEIQAVLLSLQLVRMMLEATAEFQAGNLQWEAGMDPTDLGLPATP